MVIETLELLKMHDVVMSADPASAMRRNNQLSVLSESEGSSTNVQGAEAGVVDELYSPVERSMKSLSFVVPGRSKLKNVDTDPSAGQRRSGSHGLRETAVLLFCTQTDSLLAPL